MSNKDLEQQYHATASRATSGLAPMASDLSRRRSTAQVAPETIQTRTMTPVENEPRARSSSQDRPKSKEEKFFVGKKSLLGVFPATSDLFDLCLVLKRQVKSQGV